MHEPTAPDSCEPDARPMPGPTSTLAELRAGHDLDDAIDAIIRAHVPAAAAERLTTMISDRTRYWERWMVEGIARHLPAFAPAIRAIAVHLEDGAALRCCGLEEASDG